jgi:hypothetical protein
MTLSTRTALQRLIQLEDRKGPAPAIANAWTDAIVDARAALKAEPRKGEPDATPDLDKSEQLRLVEQGIAFCFDKFRPGPFEARYIDPWVVADVFGPEALAEFGGSRPSSKQGQSDAVLEGSFRNWYEITHGSPYFGSIPLCDAIRWAQHLLQRSAQSEPGPSLADVRQLCADNEISMVVDSNDFDTVVVAISEIVRTALTRWGNLVTSPATEPGVDQWYPDFAEWLEGEMPEGTVIGDPLWWASKIADRIICTPALLQQVSTPTAPKRVEGVGELVEELELMANRAADALQFGDAHFLFRAVALLQQLQTEQP